MSDNAPSSKRPATRTTLRTADGVVLWTGNPRNPDDVARLYAILRARR